VRFPSRTTALAVPGIACAGVLAMILVAGGGGNAVASDQPTVVPDVTRPARAAVTPHAVPVVLEPPAGNAVTSVFAAAGVQVYQCTAGAWAFVEPVATLTSRPRGPLGPHTAVHFRGPTWQSAVDGSLVVAAAAASSPVAGSIPELLLQARSNAGSGVFGQVTYIQRLATSGGVAPAAPCTEGARAAVPYRAEYRFFAAATG